MLDCIVDVLFIKKYKYRFTDYFLLNIAYMALSSKQKMNLALKSSTVTQIKNELHIKSVDPSPTVKNEEKAKRKAERKAQFEAERAAKLKQQTGNDSVKGNIKSKAELRAERRTLQETQRAAKANAQTQNSIQIQKNKVNTVTTVVNKTINDLKPIKKVKKVKKDQLFGYLRQNKSDERLLKTPPFSRSDLHPAVVRLGFQYSDGLISGSNARCIAFLLAMKELITEYVTPSNKEMCRDLCAKMDVQMNFLLQSRPVSMSVENANTFLKRQLAHVTRETSDSDVKSMLLQAVETYIKEEILISDIKIADFAFEKIKDGDVILVFSHSSVVNTVLKRAFSAGVIFQVIIVVGLLKSEGIKTKRCLIRHGIECTYALISGISSAMEKASKVFLGAHALLYNGYVMSRVGTALVALAAKAHNVPVLVCCESHKFTEKIQIDSLICNELGNPDDLIRIKTNSHSNRLPNSKNARYLDYVYLMYDVMPRELVTVVISEFGLVPSTSVVAILKIKRKII